MSYRDDSRERGYPRGGGDRDRDRDYSRGGGRDYRDRESSNRGSRREPSRERMSRRDADVEAGYFERHRERIDPREYRMRLEERSKTSIYVGNLYDSVKEDDLYDMFIQYGKVKDVDIKRGRNGNSKAYAFIEYDCLRDAEDAVAGTDGRTLRDVCVKSSGSPTARGADGARLRVELTGGRSRGGRGGGGGRGYGQQSYPERRGRVTVREEFRVYVTNLPTGCRWQHLKDHMRKAGDVTYANVEHGRGVVEFTNSEDVRYALEELDGSELEASHSVRAIRVKRSDEARREYARSRSDSRGPSPRRADRRSSSINRSRRSRSPPRRQEVGRDISMEGRTRLSEEDGKMEKTRNSPRNSEEKMANGDYSTRMSEERVTSTIEERGGPAPLKSGSDHGSDGGRRRGPSEEGRRKSVDENYNKSEAKGDDKNFDKGAKSDETDGKDEDKQ